MAYVKQEEQSSLIYENVEDPAACSYHNHQIPRSIIEQIQLAAQNVTLVDSQLLNTISKSPINSATHQKHILQDTIMPAVFASHRQSPLVGHTEIMQDQRLTPEIIQNTSLVRQDNTHLFDNRAQMEQNGLVVTRKHLGSVQGRTQTQNGFHLPIQIKSEAPEGNHYLYHQMMQAYTENGNSHIDQGNIGMVNQPGSQSIPFVYSPQNSSWLPTAAMKNDNQQIFYQAHTSDSNSEGAKQSLALKEYNYEFSGEESEVITTTLNYEKTNNIYDNECSKNENDSSIHNKLPNSNNAFYRSSLEAEYACIKGEYSCPKCNIIYPTKRALKQHLKHCPKNTEICEKGKVSCSQCPYTCQSPAILKIHERTHTGEKPFSCSMCDYRSGQKNNVAKHILVHMKEKPFKCQYCEYRCAQKNNLVVHERTHTGFKPFACTLCDYKTVQKPNLVKHMYLHTGQKPFACDQCSYRCVQKTNLTKHKLRHLNEKPGEPVVYKHVDKPYRPRQTLKCQMCTFTCVKRPILERHIAENHNGAEVSVSVECNVAYRNNEAEVHMVKTSENSMFHCQSVDSKNEMLPSKRVD